MEWLEAFVQGLIDAVGAVIEYVFSLLPDSPFLNMLQNAPPDVSKYLGMLNWLLPVDWVLVTLTAYITAVMVYYAVRWIMRFIRYIQ